MIAADRITYLLDHYPPNARVYKSRLPKPGGGFRPITKPNKELKKWLRDMNRALRVQYNNWPKFMHGGIKKRSYISYARLHVNKPCVITIDIKRCFDSITTDEVAEALQRYLQLPEGGCKQLAQRLCFLGHIPQGFPTSNYLCNAYLCEPLSALQKSLATQGIMLTNYVDDLAASGRISAPDEVVNEIALTLSHAQLAVSKAKVRIMPSSRRQLICGLIVNKRLSLTRSLKLKLLRDIATGQMSE